MALTDKKGLFFWVKKGCQYFFHAGYHFEIIFKNEKMSAGIPPLKKTLNHIVKLDFKVLTNNQMYWKDGYNLVK